MNFSAKASKKKLVMALFSDGKANTEIQDIAKPGQAVRAKLVVFKRQCSVLWVVGDRFPKKCVAVLVFKEKNQKTLARLGAKPSMNLRRKQHGSNNFPQPCANQLLALAIAPSKPRRSP